MSEPYRIQVTAVAEYVAEQSRPQDDHYVFAYHITVMNTGSVRARLLTRHWIITDGNGKVEEVRGPGVVGEQPILRPGQHFEYTSGCVLETPRGSMEGSYQMTAESGRRFDAEIARFELALPYSLN